MQGFGLSDLFWVLAIVGAYLLAPTIVRRVAPMLGAFSRGEVIQVRVKPEITSSRAFEDDRTGAESGSNRFDAPDADAERPGLTDANEPDRVPVAISHNMSKNEVIVLLAVQKDSEGKYRYSANKIADFVGGTSAEVKGQVAAIRGKREVFAARPSNSIRRPVGGWQS